MRIHVLSDLHLEFSPFAPQVTAADVIILAGDIHVKGRGVSWARHAFEGDFEGLHIEVFSICQDLIEQLDSGLQQIDLALTGPDFGSLMFSVNMGTTDLEFLASEVDVFSRQRHQLGSRQPQPAVEH